MKKENLYKNLPETPGVYLMRGARNKLLYVGKAGNLKRRVSSYFTRPGDIRIERLVKEIKKVETIKTDTAIEALMLEAELIKIHQPPFNIKEKDDKSFLYVDITKDPFPQIILSRGKNIVPKNLNKRYGPFTSPSHIREALRIIRRIFPFSIHEKNKVGVMKRPCFDYQVGLCPGTCIGEVSKTEYKKDTKNIKLLFEAKRKRIITNLEKEMKTAATKLEFERAEKYKRQLFALQHIQDVALISENIVHTPGSKEKRIEGYDISNISGTSAVGSMVVSTNGRPDKNEYRKFKIKTVQGSNDVAMLTEMLYRRFNNKWRLPDLILIDGGKAQVNAAKRVLRGRNLKIPVIGIAKGPERKRNDIIGKIPKWTKEKELTAVRDEAHRFAIKYHKELRGREFVK